MKRLFRPCIILSLALAAAACSSGPAEDDESAPIESLPADAAADNAVEAADAAAEAMGETGALAVTAGNGSAAAATAAATTTAAAE
jgi:hypothetical protein